MKRVWLPWVLSLLLTLPVWSARPMRCYHDEARNVADTLMWLTSGAPYEQWKAMEIRASMGRTSSSGYGIAWGRGDSLYYTATVTAVADDGYESSIEPGYLMFHLARHDGGSEEIIETRKLTGGFDIYRAENSLALELDCNTGIAEIYGGGSLLEKITEIESPRECAQGSMGIVALGKPEIELVVSEAYTRAAGAEVLPVTADEIMERSRRQDAAKVEGVWEYLDRDNDSSLCRLGGNYRLGVTTDAGGALVIVYLEGAKVNASDWKPGMIKGRLVPTPFQNHYDLLWIDATMQPINEECSATLEPAGTLRLDFPLLKTTFRLSRFFEAK